MLPNADLLKNEVEAGGGHYVGFDPQAQDELMGMTSNQGEYYKPEREAVDAIEHERMMKFTVDEYAKAIDQEISEKGSANIMLSPIGSIPMVLKLIDEYRDSLDWENVNWNYALKDREGNTKIFKINSHGSAEELHYQSVSHPSKYFLLEDIVDSVSTHFDIGDKLETIGAGTLHTFAPAGKGNSSPGASDGTIARYNNRYPNNDKSTLQALVREPQIPDDKHSIHIAWMVENRWIQTGFGMNGDEPETTEENEVRQRFAAGCMVDVSVGDQNEYGRILLNSSTIHIPEAMGDETNMASPIFDQLVALTKRIKDRPTGIDNRAEDFVVTMAHSIVTQALDNEMFVIYKNFS